MGMLGCALVYVGFALFINALMLLDKLDGKQAAPMNVFLGGLILAHVMRTVFLQGQEIGAYFFSMQFLLFAFTFLWLSVNQIWELEGKGLGWYCLLVVIVAVPTSLTALPDTGLFILWLIWAINWFMFFLLLVLGKQIARVAATFQIGNAVVTGVAGYLILIQAWPWLTK